MTNATIEQMQKEFEEAITPNKDFKNLWELKGVKEFKIPANALSICVSAIQKRKAGIKFPATPEISTKPILSLGI